MQNHRLDALRQYLQLVRLPNVFTAPSNILVGYFAALPTTVQPDGSHLATLMISSALLYIAGIVLNDYSDVEVDKKERPSRPLALGAVPIRHAKIIALAAIAAANALALTVSMTSLAVSLALTGAIAAYDFRLKRSAITAPISMANTRFLNVMLGASPILISTFEARQSLVIVASSVLFVYILAIMLLSKKEVGPDRPNIYPAIVLVLAVVISLFVIALVFGLEPGFLVNFAIFALIISIISAKLINAMSKSADVAKSIQYSIKYLVLSIIVLDSVLIAGTAGLAIGLATLILLLPAWLIAKKLYVT